MPPRAARSTQQNKSRQPAQDRDSPAASLDTPNPSSKPSPAANPRKRAAPATGNDGPANGSTKRKRVDQNGAAEMITPSSANAKTKVGPNASTNASNETEENRITFDFTTLPADALRKYILRYDLVPPMYPNPDSHYTPPLPQYLVNPPPPPAPRSVSPVPAPGSSYLNPANRSRRDPKVRATSSSYNGRRSSRLLEDEQNQAIYAGVKEKHGNPILNDLLDTEKALAEIAKRHWEKVVLPEGEVLTSFSWRLRNKGTSDLHMNEPMPKPAPFQDE
ncbi:hypothetical protein FRB99_000510 [Tulasnella sp. 403]|nr:hypothetical protein FRB99_000510 [Tulasnella sp. 403]